LLGNAQMIEDFTTSCLRIEKQIYRDRQTDRQTETYRQTGAGNEKSWRQGQ